MAQEAKVTTQPSEEARAVALKLHGIHYDAGTAHSIPCVLCDRLALALDRFRQAGVEQAEPNNDAVWLAVVEAVKAEIENAHCLRKLPIGPGGMLDLARLALRTFRARAAEEGR